MKEWIIKDGEEVKSAQESRKEAAIKRQQIDGRSNFHQPLIGFFRFSFAQRGAAG